MRTIKGLEDRISDLSLRWPGDGELTRLSIALEEGMLGDLVWTVRAYLPEADPEFPYHLIGRGLYLVNALEEAEEETDRLEHIGIRQAIIKQAIKERKQ